MNFSVEDLNNEIKAFIDFKSINKVEEIQSLWSGYGSVLRVFLEGAAYSSVVVKWIEFSNQIKPKSSWSSEFAHKRKLNSYRNELTWYQYYSFLLNGFCKMPTYLGHNSYDHSAILLLSDLGLQGYKSIGGALDYNRYKICLTWLAHLHAFFLKDDINDLWQEGTYWHLSTRPDEFEAMQTSPLRNKASYIDQALKKTKYLTVIHGDAKPDNFLFNGQDETAAVDFQYTGIGCGMKDIVCLLSSLGEEMNQYLEQDYLTHYFTALRTACQKCYLDINLNDLEGNWRALYPFAWADYQRFLEGWSPDHWKMTEYMKIQVEKALKAIG